MGFVLLAIQWRALESDYGRLILTGLCACAVGDVFLLSRKNKLFFKSGMAAFALGHVFYILAANHISHPDLAFIVWIGSFILGLTFAWFMFRYYRPSLSKDMIWPVGVYTFIISLMCIYAVQSDLIGKHIYIIPAAFAFAVSDIFVARDRFIQSSPRNFWAITPLYFGAQALFAYSVMP